MAGRVRCHEYLFDLAMDTIPTTVLQFAVLLIFGRNKDDSTIKACWINKAQWIVVHVAIPVEILSIAKLRDIGIGAQEPSAIESSTPPFMWMSPMLLPPIIS